MYEGGGGWSRQGKEGRAGQAADGKVRKAGRVWQYTRWFKYDRDYFCVNKSQFVLVIFEPPCSYAN